VAARQEECLHRSPLAPIGTVAFSRAPDGPEYPASVREGVGGMP
jgi:hypothetical protein